MDVDISSLLKKTKFFKLLFRQRLNKKTQSTPVATTYA